MTNNKELILERKITKNDLVLLVRNNLISNNEYDQLLDFSGLRPTSRHWRSFLETMLAGLGTALLLAGIIMFFAFNWAEMSKALKFGIIQFVIVLTAGFAWKKGVDTLSGKLALLCSGTLVGVLFAVFGQIYQTGADPYELFLYWSLLILPFVIVARFQAYWLLWLLLLNLTVFLFITQALRVDITLLTYAYIALAVNGLFLLLWEWVALRGVRFAQEKLLPSVVMVFCILVLTFSNALWILFSNVRWFRISDLDIGINTFLYAVLLAAVLLFYKEKKHNLFILSFTLLSVAILLFVIVGRLFSSFLDSYFLMSLFILAETGLIATWLRKKQLQWVVS